MKTKVEFEFRAMQRSDFCAISTPLETGSGSHSAPQLIKSLLIALTLVPLSGCGLFFGGNQTVDNKSHNYEVLRLDHDSSSPWRRIDAEAMMEQQVPEQAGTTEPGPSAHETGDVAFEHRKTGAIIGVNSVCRDYGAKTLEELSAQLLIGVRPNTDVKTKDITVAGVPARVNEFETVMVQRAPSNGSRNHEITQPVRVRAVVFRKGACTYDIMYLANPKTFKQNTQDFDRFVRGFHAE